MSTVVELLEFRGAETQHVEIRQDIVKRLGASSAHAVLDIGTGTGVYARDFARATTGHVAGLDSSLAMTRAARGLAEDVSVEWLVSDVHSLPFSDSAFDVVFGAMTLSHVDDVAGAVDELWRVTAPGGRLALLEQDLKSLVINGDDSLERRIMNAHCDTIVNPRCALTLRGTLADRTSQDPTIVPYVYVDTAYALYIRSFAERSSQVAVDSGAISPEEHSAWLEGLERDARSGRFFAAFPYFLFYISKPSRA